jgi:hypothetical protein
MTRARGIAVEECWTLLGQRRGRVWRARAVRHVSGQPASVEADGAWALAREESRGDVLGFLHTHPMGGTRPSARDVRTMRAWCDALGKPLLCLIRTPAALAGFVFEDVESSGTPLRDVERFARGLIVGVEHGWEVPSRVDLSWGGGGCEVGGVARGAVRRRRGRVEPRG